MELKNAIRVLAEDNLMEDVWGGFGEPGYAILVTPKNQHTKSGQNVCPICEVTDVTIRYTHIFHAAAGIMLATSMSGMERTERPPRREPCINMTLSWMISASSMLAMAICLKW